MSELTGRQLAQAIADACLEFGLAPTEARLVSRSENIVCGLTMADGGRFAIRMHRPGYNTLSELESGVRWVQTLATAGVPVPQPIATAAGPYYASVAVGDQTRHVGIERWIDGKALDEELSLGKTDQAEHYARLGALAAQIRLHSNAWHRPADFARRSWDVDGLLGDNPLWGRFWDAKSLSDEQRIILSRCRDALRCELQLLPVTTDRFGLIHADLHLANLVVGGDELTVIDFDDAGFGWYEYELAVALHPIHNETWEPQARAAMLDAYRSAYPVSEHSEALIGTFVTMRCLMVVGWLDQRPELSSEDHAAAVADRATNEAVRYLDRM